MAEPVIITVAITGALPKKKDNPAVPVIPSEQVAELVRKIVDHCARFDRRPATPTEARRILGLRQSEPARI